MNEEKGFSGTFTKDSSDAESKLDPSIIPSNVKKIDISVNESMKTSATWKFFNPLNHLKFQACMACQTSHRLRVLKS